MSDDILIFGGSGSRELTAAICRELGAAPGRCETLRDAAGPRRLGRLHDADLARTVVPGHVDERVERLGRDGQRIAGGDFLEWFSHLLHH